MTRTTKQLLRTGLLALVVAGAGLVTVPSPASAAMPVRGSSVTPAAAACGGPIACDEKTQWLTSSPTASMPESCVSRPISLAPMNYTWEIFTGDGSYGGWIWRSYDTWSLPWATYTWTTCLIPENGYYDETSTLSTANADYSYSGSFVLPVSGSYPWGSWLAQD